jgi:hypothetical protein
MVRDKNLYRTQYAIRTLRGFGGNAPMARERKNFLLAKSNHHKNKTESGQKNNGKITFYQKKYQQNHDFITYVRL